PGLDVARHLNHDDGLPRARQRRGGAAAAAARPRAEAAAGPVGFEAGGIAAAAGDSGQRRDQKYQANAASNAASEVAARLTPSLSSHAMPPFRMVRVPHRCTRQSLAASHAGQWNRPWARAPSAESAAIPAKPTSVPTGATPGDPA